MLSTKVLSVSNRFLINELRSTTPVFVTTYQKNNYFTNANNVNNDDPYYVLGLQWGDGATTKEIQLAYRKQASKLHPDVNKIDSPIIALRKFQNLQKAYEKLMKIHTNLPGIDTLKDDEWRFSVWRNSDRIAIDRTDVAGIKRKRPAMPAKRTENFGGATLGHPDGRGRNNNIRGEYLEDGNNKLPTSSVGRGLNKWVTKSVEFIPWNKDKKFDNNKKDEEKDVIDKIVQPE